MGSDTLSAALADLRDRVVATCFPLDLPGAVHARLARRELIEQLDDYVLPRLAVPRAPLLAVVGGSTGAGRSTLVNALVGRALSAVGSVRPTTRVPVLVCRSGDRHWFAADTAIELRLDERVPPGLALLDVPDIDSVSADNRRVAVRLLGAADLWVFVTSAARYADAAPWHLLRLARDRNTRLAIVLNRVPAEPADLVRADFVRLLRQAGLGDVPLYPIVEVEPGAGLPERNVVPIRTWLAERGADPDARAAVVRRTLGGLLHSLDRRVPPLAQAVERQYEAAGRTRDCVDRAYAATARWALRALDDGSLLRGAAGGRWHEGDADGAARGVREGLDALLADAFARGAERSSGCVPYDGAPRLRPGPVVWPGAGEGLALIAAVGGPGMEPGIGREAAGLLGTRIGVGSAARLILDVRRGLRAEFAAALDAERGRRVAAVAVVPGRADVGLIEALDLVRRSA
ncbi:GTPase domain-containing protein [Embleya hyalina]|uniref:ATP-binding protein n=1 Tax=Embleya hyalina TaxID=516124 RepID=A0A401Z213_9ACTN|nr:GTPase domain-containing protein [Embleya hyalina]GCE00917.1 ATP-binding protein [Embleya hyalina]